MANIAPFFNAVARQLTASVPAPHAGQYQIVDAPQRAAAIGWQAVSVHPLQVLETEYQRLVREQRAQAQGVNARREAEAAALARFFVLDSQPPEPLDLPDSPLRTQLRNAPMADQRLQAMREQLERCERLASANPALPLAPALADAVNAFLQQALGLCALAVPVRTADLVADPIWAALEYLHFTDQASQPDAIGAWRAANAAKDPAALVDDLHQKVMRPLSSAALSVASVRALYNIRDFYLYRLMHRFEGYAAQGRMDLDTKAVISGDATKYLHSSFDWLTPWHEARVRELADAIANLNQQLRQQWHRNQDCLRFFLKGGRALFTALGAPAEGGNDWDTGVLIDPTLPAADWYAAFGAVNDLVLAKLDVFRFQFNALMYAHANALNAWRPPQPQALLAAAHEALPEASPYSEAALHAEDLAERLRAAPRTTGGKPATGIVLANLGDPSGPVGINGELIDIGIATRSSVELREHWHEVRIGDRPGVSQVQLPVPDLGYFVDDFSTIVREALATGQPPQDTKLAKRLERLDRALCSGDADLRNAVAARRQALATNLPACAAALGNADDPVARMRVWALASLLTALQASTPAVQQGWCQALDAWLAPRLRAGTWVNLAAVDFIWNAIRDDRALRDAERAARCREILAVLGAAAQLADTAMRSLAEREQALTAGQLGARRLDQALQALGIMQNALNDARHAGTVLLTGAVAVRSQAEHAGLGAQDWAAAWPVDVVEAEVHLNAPLAQPVADTVARMLIRSASANPWRCSQQPDGTVLVQRANRDWEVGGTLPDADPVVMALRLVVPVDADAVRSADVINGQSVQAPRPLTLAYRDRGGHAADFRVRQALRATADLVGEDILGRPL
ncbi:hypothetical protein FX016_15505 [Cupriavidus gilardii]|nr:hypothetical protein FX016_15505 [Cupriavidus gilardii]